MLANDICGTANVDGQISDAMCKSDHAMMQKGAMKMSERECTMACVKAGQKYVLVRDGKVYQIANQNFEAFAANAGAKVTVTGQTSADGASIGELKIAKIKW